MDPSGTSKPTGGMSVTNMKLVDKQRVKMGQAVITFFQATMERNEPVDRKCRFLAHTFQARWRDPKELNLDLDKRCCNRAL